MTAELLAHHVAGAARPAADPLLLLNGGLMSMAAWEPVAAPLQRELQVVRCDFRGQLRSPGEPPPDLAGHADDVARLLGYLEAKARPRDGAGGRAHVVGVSFGAMVAVELAARHPERVASLVLVTATDRVTPAMEKAGEALRVAAREAAAGEGDAGRVLDAVVANTYSPEFVAANRAAMVARRAVVAALPRSWFAGLVGLLAALSGVDLRPQLARIRCPTLVVGAGLDATFPPAHSYALAAAVRGARLAMVPDVGHGLVIERPDEIVARVRLFLTDQGVLAADAAVGTTP